MVSLHLEDPSTISGAGSSLSVLLNHFIDTDIVWFTKTYGKNEEYGIEDDSCYIVGVLPESISLQKNQQSEQHILRQTFPNKTIKEAALSSDVAQQLGLIIDEEGRITNYFEHTHPAIVYKLYLHDDCFFWLHSSNLSFIDIVIHSTLELFSYYERTEIRKENSVPQIKQLLEEKQKITVTAARGKLVISWPDTRALLKRIFISHSHTVKLII